MDNELTSGQKGKEELIAALQALRETASKTNRRMASLLGINAAAAVTCVKPSGTVSQLVDSASGIHPRHSRHYIRRVRSSNNDALTRFLSASGVPNEPCAYAPGSTVFSFPVASPSQAIVRDDMDALQHLELCLEYQRHWCEHKPSVTISVREDEWDKVGSWVYSNFDELAGVSFLPFDTGHYKQTPYEAISEDVYHQLKAAMPTSIDWEKFQAVERGTQDHQVGRDLACSTGECEVIGEPVEPSHQSLREPDAK